MRRSAREGWPFAAGATLVGGLCGLAHPALGLLGPAAGAAMLFFFRDPQRQPPADEALVLAGADGLIRAVDPIDAEPHLGCDTVRISTYLGLLDVHINRAPLPGRITQLAYVRGRHLFTRSNASSDHNQHSTIVIDGPVPCLVKQIVGPVVRRVVYWLETGQRVSTGERIGMMKFGSRLDVYLPRDAVEVLVEPGQRVRAGETPIARLSCNNRAGGSRPVR